VLYGRVMRIAAEARRSVGSTRRTSVRTRSSRTRCSTTKAKRRRFGRALQARFPAASAGFDDEHDCLSGLDREAAQVFAGLDGKCSQ